MFTSSPLAFVSIAPTWRSGEVSSFSAIKSGRQLCRLARPRSSRVRWFAVAGTPTPPSPDDDDDESSSDNEEKDPSKSESDESLEDVSESLRSSILGKWRSNRSDDGSRDSEFDLDLTKADGEKSDDGERNELFKFIKSIPPPELVQRFTTSAPPVVQKAIRETLVSILGSLPPLAFYTTVSSMSANLVQLFHSTLVTGYMFRNAAYRLELTRSLDWSGLKALPSSENQPEIKGGVAVFKQSDGTTVEVPVDQYIGELRDTVKNLRNELQKERKGGNELLSFISTMDKENIEQLTKNAGKEVVEAMKKVVDFVTATQGIEPNRNAVIEASVPELGQLLFYLMVSGFFLREAEVRLDLQRQIGGQKPLSKMLEGNFASNESSQTTPGPQETDLGSSESKDDTSNPPESDPDSTETDGPTDSQ